MNAGRLADLQELTREGIAYILQEDLDGHSENLKEVWENTRDKAEQEAVNAELRRIVKWLKESK